jgi:glycosyltransferase involved in cell wall biosynthesis
VDSIKISIITVTYNAAHTIERCIRSVATQNYPNVEYIIIDGQSTDHTALIINKYQNNIHTYISGPDKGIYDAMNKGVALATGNVIGMLNADDFFVDDEVLSEVAKAFTQPDIDAVYGDINFVNRHDKVVRKWRSGKYKHGYFNKGWMPPHPSFYVKKEVFELYGKYSLNYGSAADYELMLRFIHVNKIKLYYIQKVMVNMLIGGTSSSSLKNRIKAWQNDLKAMRHNGLMFPSISILLKPLRKVIQYL